MTFLYGTKQRFVFPGLTAVVRRRWIILTSAAHMMMKQLILVALASLMNIKTVSTNEPKQTVNSVTAYSGIYTARCVFVLVSVSVSVACQPWKSSEVMGSLMSSGAPSIRATAASRLSFITATWSAVSPRAPEREDHNFNNYIWHFTAPK